MTNHDEERGKNYIHARPQEGTAEEAVNAAKGLDFQGRKSVNPEDPTGGTLPMKPQFDELETTEAPTLTSITGLEHLFLGEDTAAEMALGGTAVTYLRVSTTRQMNTAADLDEDGNSIATQRE